MKNMGWFLLIFGRVCFTAMRYMGTILIADIFYFTTFYDGLLCLAFCNVLCGINILYAAQMTPKFKKKKKKKKKKIKIG